MVAIARHGEKAAAGDGSEGEEGKALLFTNDWAIGRVGVGVLKGHRISGLFAHPARSLDDNLELIDVMEMRFDPGIRIKSVDQKRLRVFVDNARTADIVDPPPRASGPGDHDFLRLCAGNGLHGASPPHSAFAGIMIRA